MTFVIFFIAELINDQLKHINFTKVMNINKIPSEFYGLEVYRADNPKHRAVKFQLDKDKELYRHAKGFIIPIANIHVWLYTFKTKFSDKLVLSIDAKEYLTIDLLIEIFEYALQKQRKTSKDFYNKSHSIQLLWLAEKEYFIIEQILNKLKIEENKKIWYTLSLIRLKSNIQPKLPIELFYIIYTMLKYK